SVRTVLFTPPPTEVAVTFAFAIGSSSSPVTWPRMTSSCWAATARGDATATARNAATKRRKRRTFTGASGMRAAVGRRQTDPTCHARCEGAAARRTRAHRLRYVRLDALDCWCRSALDGGCRAASGQDDDSVATVCRYLNVF